MSKLNDWETKTHFEDKQDLLIFIVKLLGTFIGERKNPKYQIWLADQVWLAKSHTDWLILSVVPRLSWADLPPRLGNFFLFYLNISFRETRET